MWLSIVSIDALNGERYEAYLDGDALKKKYPLFVGAPNLLVNFMTTAPKVSVVDGEMRIVFMAMLGSARYELAVECISTKAAIEHLVLKISANDELKKKVDSLTNELAAARLEVTDLNAKLNAVRSTIGETDAQSATVHLTSYATCDGSNSIAIGNTSGTTVSIGRFDGFVCGYPLAGGTLR
jgi:hypothetical protein